MAVDRSEIDNVAALARIAIDDADIADMTDRLNRVLGLVDQLQATDTEGVAPLAHPLEVSQRLRPDQVTESNQRETFQAIAPAVADGLFLVPKVIE